MTKSRSALCVLFALAWPGAASALPVVPMAAPGIIAAPPDPLADAARRSALRVDLDCNAGRSEDEVVVCGRRRLESGSLRVPYEREPGARIRLTAGELPSARDALSAGGCLRLCPQPVMINVISAITTVARGIDRILHPD
jgi:hypothetical protein